MLIDDAYIAQCGFRMFVIPEIARTMQMQWHPNGGDYIVLGNKRDVMAQLGNAVTPPVTRLLLGKVFEVLGGGATFVDLFCGAGGSSIGASQAGGELVLGLNHWPLAIETHSTNFPDAEHDCADVSALTTSQIRRYPDSDVLLASPECTSHSLAKGAKRVKPQAASLFDDGPADDDAQDRSRATMWDVCRFAEQKCLKGKPYQAMIVENVTDAFRWGADDNGLLFQSWRMALEGMGYESEIVWLNSMFAPPTPQSRDRMYVVFWRKGIRRPNLRVEPPSWCPRCVMVVDGQQVWKRPQRPLETAAGKPVGAKYGTQYLYGCPSCHGIVIPGAFPAASAIDFSIPAPLIGERSRELAPNTMARIKRGLVKLHGEPFAIRLLQSGNPRPLTLPFVTLTQRHDLAMVMPVAGNTFERTPGNRARDAATRPMDTVHGTLDRAMILPPMGGVDPRNADTAPGPTQTGTTRAALVMANTENGMPRNAEELAAQTLRTEGGLALVMANRANNVPRNSDIGPVPAVMTGGTIGLVELQNHGGVRNAEHEPAGTMRASGFHHGIVVSNYGPGGAKKGKKRRSSEGDGGWARRAEDAPFGSITVTDGHSLVIPYQSEPHGVEEPARTVTTVDRIALLVPPTIDA